jgi:hypothetical protein
MISMGRGIARTTPPVKAGEWPFYTPPARFEIAIGLRLLDGNSGEIAALPSAPNARGPARVLNT